MGEGGLEKAEGCHHSCGYRRYLSWNKFLKCVYVYASTPMRYKKVVLGRQSTVNMCVFLCSLLTLRSLYCPFGVFAYSFLCPSTWTVPAVSLPPSVVWLVWLDCIFAIFGWMEERVCFKKGNLFFFLPLSPSGLPLFAPFHLHLHLHLYFRLLFHILPSRRIHRCSISRLSYLPLYIPVSY